MKKPLRVLMVEDSEDDALLEIRALKNGGYDPKYERVETAGDMLSFCRVNAQSFQGSLEPGLAIRRFRQD
jgi:hypothetical protein